MNLVRSLLRKDGTGRRLRASRPRGNFAGGNDSVFAYDADIAMAALAIGQFADAIAAARSSISRVSGWYWSSRGIPCSR